MIHYGKGFVIHCGRGLVIYYGRSFWLGFAWDCKNALLLAKILSACCLNRKWVWAVAATAVCLFLDHVHVQHDLCRWGMWWRSFLQKDRRSCSLPLFRQEQRDWLLITCPLHSSYPWEQFSESSYGNKIFVIFSVMNSRMVLYRCNHGCCVYPSALNNVWCSQGLSGVGFRETVMHCRQSVCVPRTS